MRDRSRKRQGSAYVELVLVGAFFLVPLILGLMSVGFALSRSLQAAQLTRDVGRMFVRGVDFAEQANQDLITGSAARPSLPPLAQGLAMAGNGGNATGGTSGNGVLVLSTFTRMATTCGCVNAGHTVLMRRVVVGNKTLFTSAYGNPSAELINVQTGAIRNYANQASALADNFSSVVNLAGSELGYLVESRFNFPDLAMPGIMENPSVAWRVVF